MQKSQATGVYFDSLLPRAILDDVCFQITKKKKYDVEFVDNDYTDEFLPRSYNKGRLGMLLYEDTANFISFSDNTGAGRNSSIQSATTAFNLFYSNSHNKKRLFFYFLPCSGQDSTAYHLFVYRLMKTAGFDFINTPSCGQRILPFSSIEDIILARRINAAANPGNNSTFIVKENAHDYSIYGKTYGANKYETSIISYAISNILSTEDNVTLYEYNERDLKELPRASLDVLDAMGNINVVNIDDELEKKELNENDSLRSPKFNARLLDRLGERHCVLCECGISEIIQGAHLWPVSAIKKMTTLSDDEKLEYATDGENGLWMCQNHHKLFDSHILLLSESGDVSYKPTMDKEATDYMDSVTTVTKLDPLIITGKYKDYIRRRYA